MNYLENLGFGYPSEEDFEAIIGMTCRDGKAKMGYYGCPYINLELGAAQLIARTGKMEEKDRLEFVGFDTHAVGHTVWEFALSEINVDAPGSDKCTKRVVAHKPSDNTGMAVINLVNADVLPSFLKNDVIKAQMIAFSELIHYYKDEEEYAESVEETLSGKKFLLGEGNVFPNGLLANHSLDNPEKDKEHYSDNFVSIRGCVKAISIGKLELGEQSLEAFISVTIDTEFGELEIVHTLDQVEESERSNIKVGSVVFGLFVLSGDVAIYEYSEGFIADEKNDLALVRYTLQAGDPERLRLVLSEEAEYISDASAATYKGADEIIERLKYIKESNPDTNFFAQMATVSSVDDGAEALPYSVGQRCIILSEDRPDNYVSIVFVDVAENGHIQRIHISEDGRYHFKIDEPPHYEDPLENVRFPENAEDSMLTRAKFHGLINRECSLEDVFSRVGHEKEYESNAKNITLTFTDREEDDILSNVFGYLFAKSAEQTYNRSKAIAPSSFKMSEAVLETYRANTDEPTARKLSIAHELGKQFFKDVKVHYELEENRGRLKEILTDALIFVQQLGEVYSENEL